MPSIQIAKVCNNFCLSGKTITTRAQKVFLLEYFFDCVVARCREWPQASYAIISFYVCIYLWRILDLWPRKSHCSESRPKSPSKKIFQNAQKREVPRKRIEFFSYWDFFVFFQTLIIYGWRVKYVGAIQDGKQDDLELRRISRKKPRKARKSKREKTNICFFFSLCLLWYIYWKRYCKLLTFMAAITHQDICSSCHLKKFFQKVVLRHCVALERQIWLEFLKNWPLKGPSWRPPKGGLKKKTSFATETQRRRIFRKLLDS